MRRAVLAGQQVTGFPSPSNQVRTGDYPRSFVGSREDVGAHMEMLFIYVNHFTEIGKAKKDHV